MKKKLISLLLACAMALCLMPTAAMAASNGKAIQLGTSGIEDPIEFTTAKGKHYTPRSYIYYGVNGDSSAPIKWRVLDADNANDKSTPGMFLLSEHLLASGIQFDKDNTANSGQINLNEWQHSDAQSWCSTFASNSSNFSVTEQAAMLGLAKTDSSETLYNNNWGTSSLTDSDKMFFLSARELSDYVGSYSYAPGLKATFADSPDAGVWWLRSHVALSAVGAGVVWEDGHVGDRHANNARASRPALNLNPDSVLFTSAAAGGKSASGMDGGLTAVPAYSSSEWKLTLKDSARDSFSINNGNVSWTNLTGTIPYSGAKIGTNEYISAIVKDSSDNITYYGRLKKIADSGDTSGTVVIDLSGIDMTNKKLYVFYEQCNGDQRTDYASPLREVVPPTYTATVTPDGKTFSAQIEGYTAREQQEFTITNTGNQELVNLKAKLGDTDSDGFILDEPSVTSLATSGSITFTVKPKFGLGAGSYHATVTVSADNMTPITKNISFTVNDKETVSTPKIDPNGGIFHGSVEVRITCVTSDARIYYTTDGSDPTASSAEYTGTPFTLARDATVKAFAVKDGMKNSSVASAVFTKYVPTYYIVTVSASPKEGGTVTGGGSYIENTSVNITATPKSGYRFVNWTEDGNEVSTDAKYNFTATANRNLVAVFQAVAPTPTPRGGDSDGRDRSSDYTEPTQDSVQNESADIRLSGIKFPNGERLVTVPAQSKALMKMLGKNKLIGIWDISLKSGKTSIEGSTLSFSIGRENAGKSYTLYHLKADGTTERFSATADPQGIVSFYPVGELSPFMLVQGGGIVTTSILQVPATGDVNAGLGLLLLSAMMAAAVVLMMRRKA